MDVIMEYAGIGAVVLVAAFEIMRRVAPLTQTDKDDALVRSLAPLAEKIKSWADPNSTEVPPSPQ